MGNGEPGTGTRNGNQEREPGTGNQERGTRNGEPGMGNQEWESVNECTAATHLIIQNGRRRKRIKMEQFGKM